MNGHDPALKGREAEVDIRELQTSWDAAHQVSIVVAGCTLAVHHFSRPGASRVLLIHGGRAHAGWWAAVARLLSLRFDVVVPDLSGHGRSGRRDEYSPELWACEAAAVLQEVGGGIPCTVVGHSMGGKVGVYLAAMAPAGVRRLVLVDSSFNVPGSRRCGRGGRTISEVRYATLNEAADRLVNRLSGEEVPEPFARWIARDSVHRIGGQWLWKVDPGVARRFTDAGTHAALLQVSVPTILIYGDRSRMVSSATRQYLDTTMASFEGSHGIQGAGHNIPLSHPNTCADHITAIAGD